MISSPIALGALGVSGLSARARLGTPRQLVAPPRRASSSRVDFPRAPAACFRPAHRVSSADARALGQCVRVAPAVSHGTRGACVTPKAAAKTTFDTATPSGYSTQFTKVRLRVFLSILIGYACYYLTRNSLTFTAPAMVATPGLGLDLTSIGVITSIFPLCYGCSKFVSGVVGDVLSPSVMLGGGLIATGLVNILFGASSTLPLFCLLWACNGILQGFGAPSCAKILTSWFAAKERGTYWGMWNIAHNLGGFAAPILAGTAARVLGWSWGLWAPGIIGVVFGTIIVLTLKDSPEAKGFEPVESAEELLAQDAGGASAASQKNESTEVSEPEPKLSLIENLFQNVLSNPFIWGLAFTYFCVYVIRQGITSWSVFYLIKEKGVVDAGAAALRVSGLELVRVAFFKSLRLFDAPA